MCKGDRGEPDTDESRKPQAGPAVNSVVFIYPRYNFIISPICSPSKKNSNGGHASLDVITNLQSNSSHGYNSYSYPRHPLQPSPGPGQYAVILALSFSPVHAGASVRIKDPPSSGR